MRRRGRRRSRREWEEKEEVEEGEKGEEREEEEEREKRRSGRCVTRVKDDQGRSIIQMVDTNLCRRVSQEHDSDDIGTQYYVTRLGTLVHNYKNRTGNRTPSAPASPGTLGKTTMCS